MLGQSINPIDKFCPKKQVCPRNSHGSSNIDLVFPNIFPHGSYHRGSSWIKVLWHGDADETALMHHVESAIVHRLKDLYLVPKIDTIPTNHLGRPAESESLQKVYKDQLRF